MKFDRLIQKLIPHDDKFFHMLEESTSNLLRAHSLKTRWWVLCRNGWGSGASRHSIRRHSGEHNSHDCGSHCGCRINAATFGGAMGNCRKDCYGLDLDDTDVRACGCVGLCTHFTFYIV